MFCFLCQTFNDSQFIPHVSTVTLPIYSFTHIHFDPYVATIHHYVGIHKHAVLENMQVIQKPNSL